MAVKMEKFLTQFYMQLLFNEMPAEKFKTFTTYIANGDDFRGDMKIWKERLVHQEDGVWKKNEIPDGRSNAMRGLPATAAANEWEISDDEWKKLYLQFRDAFIVMDTNRSKFADSSDKDTYNKDAANFLNDYFGDTPDKIFSNVLATPAAENDIAAFATLINNNPGLERVFINWGILNSDFTFSDLKKGIGEKKYNKDATFRKKLQNLAEWLHEATDQNGINFEEQIFNALGGITHDFPNLKTGFDEKFVDTTPGGKLDQFKAAHKDLLHIVGKNKKIQEQFRSEKIASALEDAQKKVSYNDKNSENFLVDSKMDQLTWRQNFEKWRKDTYKDVFEKYKWLQGDRLYYSPQAAKIVDALNSKNVKPTDGLDGIVKVAGDVEAELAKSSASAAKHFKWTVKTLDEIKKVMPKAYEGALLNGHQLNHVIEDLIIRAVRDAKNGNKDAIPAAKSAMEIISVCKYGMTTSKIMDALSKEQLTVFSDKDLSWMKNEGTAFVARCFDKSIDTAMKGIGYGITALVNQIRKSGSKFNGHRGKRLQTEFKQWDANNTAEKNAAILQRNTLNPTAIADRTAAETRMNNTGITDATIDNFEQTQRNEEAVEKQLLDDLNIKANDYAVAQNDFNQKDQARQNLQNIINNHPTNDADLVRRSKQLRQQYTAVKNQLRAIPTPYPNANEEMKARNLQALFKRLYDERQQTLSQIRTGRQEFSNANTNIANATIDATNAQTAMNNADRVRQSAELRYNNIHTANTDRQNKISEFKNSRERIKELTEQIERRNKIVADWDKDHTNLHDELAQFWDFLETGRDSRTGPFYNRFTLSKKSAQADFDTTKVIKFQQYQSHYSMAA